MTLTRLFHALYTLIVRCCTFHSSGEAKSASHKPGLFMLFTASLLLSLAACSSNVQPTTEQPSSPTATSIQGTPTPTPLPAGIVLYQANLSKEPINLQDFHGWKEEKGQLVSDSAGNGSFVIPYTPTTENYSIEIKVQIEKVINGNGGYFVFTTPDGAGKDGYLAGVSDLKFTRIRPNGDHPEAAIFLRPSNDQAPGTGMPRDYEPGANGRVYSIKVQGTSASLLIDGVLISQASTQQATAITNKPIKFSTSKVILRISEIRIVTV